MEFPSNEVISVIRYLLPGFLAAWVFYGLTAHPKQTPFERIIQALIFTVIVEGVTALIRSIYAGHRQALGRFNFGDWTTTADAVAPPLVATIIGVVFAFLANHNWVHGVLRRLWITKRTSYPSQWFSAFNRDRWYVTLHLKGIKQNRRLYGWAEEWPDQPDNGHFIIMEPSWLLDDGDCAPYYLVDRLLVPANQVEMVEIMKRPGDVQASQQQITEVESKLIKLQKEEADDGKSSTTAAPEIAVEPTMSTGEPTEGTN